MSSFVLSAQFLALNLIDIGISDNSENLDSLNAKLTRLGITKL
jgi:hypothetical protein